MKKPCLILVILGFSAAEVASASAVSKQGFFQPGLKLDAKPAEPEEGTVIHVDKEKLLPPGVSHVPLLIQYLCSGAWILMIASLPFIMPIVDHRPVTLCQKVVGALMLLTLFGGVYLFTHVVLFQSVHFDKQRPLTQVECIYFMSQVITTVGYGDITPVSTRGQVFVAVYILGALFVICMLVSEITVHCTVLLNRQREAMFGITPRGEVPYKTTLHDLLEPEDPSGKNLLRSMAAFAVIDVIWVTFFSQFPGENKSVFESIYMSFVTFTTVGFGAFTPLTEEGMIFGAFFMIVGSACVVNMITNFCSFIAMMNEYQRFDSEVKKSAIDDLRKSLADGSKVTEMEFFRFIVRYHGNVTTDAIQDSIHEVFQGLKPQNGVVELKDVVRAMDVERSRGRSYSIYFSPRVVFSTTSTVSEPLSPA